MIESRAPGLASVLLLAACSSSSSAPSPSGGGGSLSGTVGGKAFTDASGIANVAGDGSIDLIFSSSPSLCDALTSGKLRAGETLVQAYGLEGTEPGTFTPKHDDVKFVRIGSACASGARITDHVEGTGRSTKSTFTISKRTSALVEGTLSITFDDGSSVEGSFSVPVCATGSPDEDALCE